MVRLWKCSGCETYFDWKQAHPAIDVPACMMYGDAGRPPFKKGDGPLIGRIRYCEDCEEK